MPPGFSFVPPTLVSLTSGPMVTPARGHWGPPSGGSRPTQGVRAGGGSGGAGGAPGRPAEHREVRPAGQLQQPAAGDGGAGDGGGPLMTSLPSCCPPPQGSIQLGFVSAHP